MCHIHTLRVQTSNVASCHHRLRMQISEEDWDISITSKSVSIPTITTSFLSVCAEVSAVETMR